MDMSSLIKQKCPKCDTGSLFVKTFKMHETCPHCGFKYERQEGYYTSAIFIGNFLYALFVAPTILIMTSTGQDVWKIIVILGGISLFCCPAYFPLCTHHLVAYRFYDPSGLNAYTKH